MKNEIIVCQKCKKEFLLEYITHPCKLGSKRTEAIPCHYCGANCGSVYLLGDEDIKTKSINQSKGGNGK